MILNELQLNFEFILSRNDKCWNQFATVVFIWREYTHGTRSAWSDLGYE